MTAEYRERADRILAELIDELVFEERQRILVEEKMGIRVEELQTLSRDLVDCVRNMCTYTLTLEEEAFPVLALAPASGGSSSPAKRMEEERASVNRSLSTVRSAVGEDVDRVAANNPAEGLAGGGSEQADEGTSHTLAAAAMFARSLLMKKDALLTPLDDVREILEKCSRRSQSLFTAMSTPPRPQRQGSTPSSAAVSPNKELRELRRELAQLSEALCRCAAGGGGTQSLSVPEAQTEGPRLMSAVGTAAAEEERRWRVAARIRAYEMTVQTLNGEVAALVEQLASREREHKVQLERGRRQRDEMEARYVDRLAECDTALCRVSLELEQLIKENAQLKKQLRLSQ